MFGRLFKPNRCIVYPEHFAKTDEVMLDQLCAAVEAQAQKKEIVFVLTHFQSTFTRIQNELDRRSIYYNVVVKPIDWSRPLHSIKGLADQINLSLVDQFVQSTSQSTDEVRDGHQLSIILAERHPLQSRDEMLESSVRAIPFKSKLGYYHSLDHPVIRYCISDTTVTLLNQMGMNDRGLITSTLISRRLISTLKKLEQQKPSWLDAESPEEWFDKNI